MPRADKKIKIFGEVFSAGIWIYIVDVKLYHERQFLYVGKTGYKKIPRDSSPWSRLAAHLDDTADKNNCLLTHIKLACPRK